MINSKVNPARFPPYVPFTVLCARERGDTEFTVRLQSQPGGYPFPICEEKENSISQMLSRENAEL